MVIFLKKINTSQFNLVNRSQYGNRCVFKHEIIEYRGNYCFIPTKGSCFVKCTNFITSEDYIKQYLDFIRNETRQSNILTKARIQPFCGANIIHLGYFGGKRVFPTSVTDRNKVLLLNKSLLWKSKKVSFNKLLKK